MTRSLEELREEFERIGCIGAARLIDEIIRDEQLLCEPVILVPVDFEGAWNKFVLGSKDGSTTVEDSLTILFNNWESAPLIDRAEADYLFLRIAVLYRTGRDIVRH